VPHFKVPYLWEDTHPKTQGLATFLGVGTQFDTTALSGLLQLGLFMKHCMANGYYVHPCILFRRDYEGNKGFICANPAAAAPAAGIGAPAAAPAVIPDLPLRMTEYIDACSLSVWTLLNKDKLFPEKSAFGTLVHKTFGKGYEALRQMIMQTSPLFDESPGDHVRSPPNQPTGKTLTEYYVVFRDYLAMSALVNNSDMSLDDPAVIDMIISGTLDYKFFKRVSREQRHQASQLHRFRDESIVATLEEYRTYPDYNPVETAQPRTREWQGTTGRSLNAVSIDPVDSQDSDVTPGLANSTSDSDDSVAPADRHVMALGLLVPTADADLETDQKYRATVYALSQQRPAGITSPCLVCGPSLR
jgi:hypothetical protein